MTTIWFWRLLTIRLGTFFNNDVVGVTFTRCFENRKFSDAKTGNIENKTNQAMECP